MTYPNAMYFVLPAMLLLLSPLAGRLVFLAGAALLGILGIIFFFSIGLLYFVLLSGAIIVLSGHDPWKAPSQSLSSETAP